MQTNQQYQFVTWTRKGQLHYKMGVDCSNFTNELEDVQYSSQTYFGQVYFEEILVGLVYYIFILLLVKDLFD